MNNSISKDELSKLENELYHEMCTLMSNLLIEQFYNTGDAGLFDRSLSLNENVSLQRISVINTLNVKKLEQKDYTDFNFFYQGMFFNLHDFSRDHDANLKIITRNNSMVAAINKKLDRARIIMRVDESTLGKKYFNGLCTRSHYQDYL